MCLVSVATGRRVGPGAARRPEGTRALVWGLILHNLITFDKAE